MPPPALKIEKYRRDWLALIPQESIRYEMDHLPVGAGKPLGILIEDDLGQVLAQDRGVTGAAGMHFRQVHDLHLAVVAQKAAFLALAREADAPGNVLVQVAEHHQWFYQEHRLAGLAGAQAQVVADPLGWAVALFNVGFVFGAELVQVELAGVVHQLRHIQGDVGTAAPQADQADRGKLLLAAQLAVTLKVRRAREDHVAQAVEVVEDAVGVGLGEVQVLLGAQRTLTVQ